MNALGVSHLARLAAITAVYFAAGRFGLSFAFLHDSASAVWPPTGVALAATLLCGVRVWPAVFAGAFLVNISTSGSVAASTGIAVGNTIEAVLGGWLVSRYARGTGAFERAGDTFRFAFLGGVAPTVLAAAVGIASLSAAGLLRPEEAFGVWLTWWLGDLGGALVVAPPIILWASRPSPDLLMLRRGEALAMFVTVSIVGLVVFSELSPMGRNVPTAFSCLPVLLWPAFRFTPRETAAAIALLSAVAVRGTLAGWGPFAAFAANDALMLLQTFLGVAAVSALAAAAEARHRREREAELSALNDELEARVRRRTGDLERAQERLKEAQQVAHVGSWEWDVAADRVWWSDEMYRTFGLDPAAFEASYESFLSCVYPDDRDSVHEHVGDALRSREPFAFEHRITRPDGEMRWVSARGDVIHDEAGQPLRMRGTAQDVTEQRQAEEARHALKIAETARLKAEEANRMKDQFLATLSHELRTPLHAVIGWSHMLVRGAVSDDRRQRALELIYRNALIQNQMISDLLDVSRITTGAFSLERGLLDLPAVLESAIETVRPKADEKQIALNAEIDAAAWVNGDARRLAQVAGNLLINAIKFTPAGGAVTLRLARTPSGAELQVEDTGPGISPAFLPHVFDRFRQADESVTREHGGLGLGLAIVRHIVELHGGRVDARNRTGSPGAVFTVTLPALDAEAAG
jgi:PAS domain S-box-containing protein